MHSVVATSVNFVQRVIPLTLAAAGQIEKLTFYASLLQEVAHFDNDVIVTIYYMRDEIFCLFCFAY